MELALIWSGEGEDRDGDWHVEFAGVELGEAGLRASGTQLGAVPVPYRLDYRLDATGEGFTTRTLQVEATGAGWRRRLRLERDPGGEWTVESAADGPRALDADGLPAPGGDAGALAGALDCDLGLSPLTNAMPVHRHRLDREPGSVDFLMAWVSVPDLAVRASRQRYQHVRRDGDRAVVRYESLEDDEVSFTSDLEFGADGLVRVYPQLARRL
jgi:uncharacterized protein